MIQLKKINSKTYQLIENEEFLGTISTYRNLFHDTCIYLIFKLQKCPNSLPFIQIYQQEQKPLQVMIESNETNLVNLLLRNSFVCKRRCFEAKVSMDQLRSPLQAEIPIFNFNNSDTIYDSCCSFLYNYYKKVHAQVSPLTASKEDFINEVPTNNGFYSFNQNGQINHLTFTEQNEIAYICSIDPQTLPNFTSAILKQMFSKHNEIFFEADDTDWAATELLNEFNYPKTNSFNTYIWKP